MKWIILVVSVFCMSNMPLKAHRYALLHRDKFPIGMWVTPPDSFRNDFHFKKLAECGLTFVNGFAPHENTTDEIIRALDLSAENDLLYFVNRASTHYAIVSYPENEVVPAQFVTGLEPFVSHPAFAGELLMDEPGKPLIKSVAAFVRVFEEHFKPKMWHVNLFPTYATGGIQTHSYEDYIDTWMAEVKPPCISYDSYPLLASGGIIDDYYYNLDLIRKKALQFRIPFWTFIQTLSISRTPGVPDKREPSREDIRWQVWSNLAFGAKGIQYFCYWTPGSATEVFTDALIGRDGNETVRYKVVQQLNKEVQAIGRKVLGSDPVGVMQIASEPYPLYDAALDTFGPVSRLSGDDVIAGCFQDEGGKSQLLVCPLRPDRGAALTVHFDRKKGSVVLSQGETSNKVSFKKGRLDLKIMAGDAVLIEFSE